jgi:diguanylate cyclase (GGDEF)-like protein
MDIRTLLVCSLALLVLQTGVLLLTYVSQRGLPGTGWLAGAFGSVALGAGLGALRGYAPDLLSIVLGNTVILLGCVLLHQAVARLLDLGWRSVRVSVLLGAGMVAGTVYFTEFAPDTRARIVWVSLLYAVPLALSASLLLRSDHDGGTRTAERFLGVVLSLLAVLNVVRAGATAWEPGPSSFLQGGWIQASSVLAFLLFSTVITFGFLWITSARLYVALHREAHLDPLTGLLNRRGFLSVAPTRLRAAEREGDRVLLLFADLDGLKEVNDTVGHDAGDRAIAEAAEVLRHVLRASDSVARLGGDEFCALIPVRDPSDGDVILRRLENRVRRHNARPAREYSLGISAATVPIDPTSSRPLEELLREVDQRMYATKRARRLGAR